MSIPLSGPLALVPFAIVPAIDADSLESSLATRKGVWFHA